MKAAAQPRELSKLAARRAESGGRFDARAMRRFAKAAEGLTDAHGRATPALQALIHELEDEWSGTLTRGARPVLQDLAARTGAKLSGPISMPKNDTPIWLEAPSPLAGFQSKPKLPKEADVVILGAGLTGASAAYHLSKAAEKKGLRVVVLEAQDPATGATGRNGGNFELIPENFFGDYGSYEGFEEERYKFLKASYPDLDEATLRRQSKRTAETILKFSLKNAERMASVIEREKIDCDFSPAGWLRTALNEKEAAAFEREAEQANALGAEVEILSPKEIMERFKFPAEHPGRLVKHNGNYHPFKFVTQELQRALDRGVELYTRTPVRRVQSISPDEHRVITDRGTILAKKVIVATNAFTSQIFPELADVKYFRSQIARYEHVENDLAGITVTAKDGDIYANFPKGSQYVDERGTPRGSLIVGGGKDVEDVDPSKAKPDPEVFAQSLREMAAHFPKAARQPAVAAWAGPMAFVEGKHGMRLPVLGPLDQNERKGVFIAIWCNGYGGTGCQQAGAGAAAWALSGRVPRDMPADVFGPRRLFTDEPQFDTKAK